MIQKESVLRSKKHRMTVASMSCLSCQSASGVQAAHRNEGKGMGIKACDSQIFPLCYLCHSALDQGGMMSKNERREHEKRLVDETRKILIDSKTWGDDIEAAYQKINARIRS
jgi:hypothetical protein